MTTDTGQHQHRLLIVDDDDGVLKALSGIFRQDGYIVTTASNGEEALRFLETELPCLVLSDVAMPKMDGYALCRRIRDNPKTAHVPTALLTGKVSDSEFEQGLAAGARDYIKKPFDRGEIRLRVRNLLLLHEAYRRREQLFDCASQGILAASAATRKFVMANPAICDMLGYPADELLTMSITDIHPKDKVDALIEEFDAQVREGKSQAHNVPFIRKDGSVVYADISTSRISFDGVICNVGFFTDVTPRHEMQRRLKKEEAQLKFMENELLHAQKMEAVGRLASGIAHEINTPTQFVGDNARFLRDSFAALFKVVDSNTALITAIKSNQSIEASVEKCESVLQEADIEYLQEEVPKAAEQALDGVSRIASIVRAMKEFAHPGTGEKTLVDINKLIESTVTVSRNEWKYDADLLFDPCPSLPEVNCLPGELNQVFLNLIVNAAHAVADRNKRENTEKKGRITIAVQEHKAGVEIRITDTGGGIPEEIREKIMEPFFTTKEVGRGTGQGLAIARSVIVDKHNGKLYFETEVGVGTTFIILLPVGDPGADDLGNGTSALLDDLKCQRNDEAEGVPVPRPAMEPMESEGKLRSLIDSMSEGMVVLDGQGIMRDANRAAEEILGTEKGEILGRKYPDTPFQFMSPQGESIAVDELPGFRSLLEKQAVRDVEMTVIQPGGGLRRVVGAAAPILGRNGAVEGTIITLVDVTVSRNIEQVLARNEATMRAILEHAPFGVMLIDREFKVITLTNAYAAALIGLPSDQIEGRVCHEFICPAEKGKCPVADLGQSVDNAERVLVTADGRHIPVLKTVVPVALQEQAFLLDCFIDITERKNLEAQLGQAQKLESVGRLAAGIAHEINTPAQYVGDNSQFLKDAFAQIADILAKYAALTQAIRGGGDLNAPIAAIEAAEAAADLEFLLEDVPSAINQSIEGIERVSSIVRAMKEFAHPGVEQKVHLDINRALETTITVSRSEWKYAAELTTDLAPDLPQVLCYPGEINQVFLNLIVNASHAVADAQASRGGGLGKIVVRTRAAGSFVEIRIEDNGTGIPTEIQGKIMEPFFTTKEVGRGSGQGLAIARSCVVAKHKGRLSFETEPGEGTTFIVLLPLNETEG